jgi:hypothetical protein
MNDGRIYIAYDTHPPYLPVAVSDSVKELADMIGVKSNVISASISRQRRLGRVGRYHVIYENEK